MSKELATLLRLSVPVIVQVGHRRVALEDVLELAPGAILELNKSSESDLDLLVNNKSIGSGVAVKVGENFGIRITSIASPEKVVQAMGA